MNAFYAFTMTYDLPQQKGKISADSAGRGRVLLETALPHLSAAQRRALMVKTALPAGYPLSGRDRRPAVLAAVNLPAAYQMAQKAH
jgi:hypothetical protein